MDTQATRLTKRLSGAGFCSRRDAEELIRQGRVSVDGVRVTELGTKVLPHQAITIDGQPLKQPPAVLLWCFYKPTGYLTTHRDPQGRPTIFSLLPEGMPYVFTVGRLDMNSEGLLLLTNSNTLAHYCEHPQQAFVRRYRVRVFGRIPSDLADRLRAGVRFQGVQYGPIEVSIDARQGSNTWLTVALQEGKNREVRNVLSSFGLEVSRLIRTEYGPFSLQGMEKGDLKLIPQRMVKPLLAG